MPILKNFKVDEFENVTIIIFKNISFRYKKVDESLHIVLSEAHLTESEVLVKFYDEEALAESTKCHNIDIIMDFPNEKSLSRYIEILNNCKNEYYQDNKCEKISREQLINEIEIIQDKNYAKFKGTNEADLMCREDIADLIEKYYGHK